MCPSALSTSKAVPAISSAMLSSLRRRCSAPGTVCARMVLQPGCEVGEHTHHGNYEVYYFLSGHGTYRSNGETTTVDARYRDLHG